MPKIIQAKLWKLLFLALLIALVCVQQADTGFSFLKKHKVQERPQRHSLD